MATVYSLVCWGGRTGKTVSISATTDVVTLTNHGLRNGHKLWPSGTLPAELSVLVPVYARSTANNTFTLHATEADAIAGTGQITFAGSSTYAAVTLKSDLIVSPSTRLTPYGLSDLSRWGDAGAERIYDGINAWWNARKTTVSFDVEFAELGEAFTEYVTATTNLSFASGAFSIQSTINGIRTAAWHARTIGAGYILSTNSQVGLSQAESYIDGFEIRGTVTTGTTFLAVSTSGVASLVSRMIINGAGGTASNGVFVSAAAARVEGCLVKACGNGLRMNTYTYGAAIGNNTVVGCSVGFSTGGNTGNIIASFVNNLSIGNTTNWQTQATGAIYASKNAGLVGDSPWVTSGGSTVTVDANWNSSTPLFMDYAGDDYRPYQSGGTLNANSTLIVDSGIEYYKSLNFDIGDRARPDYMNGAAEYRDIGAFEFDHGFGEHPASATIALTNIASGSQVRITKDTDGGVLYNNAPGASLSFATTYIGAFTVVVRKASSAPFYREFLASGTTVANQTTTIKCLQQLDE